MIGTFLYKISQKNKTDDCGGIQCYIESYPSKKEDSHSFSRKNGVLHWTAWDKNGEAIQIESAVPKRTYFCPTCNGEMVAVKGQIKAHHYRHKPEPKDGSNGVATGGCGGEGARHFRVKTFANRIINSVRTKNRAVRMNSKMEKRINEDQPDITVFVYGKPQLAIEIVDSNPPSQEKLDRWGDNMLTIDISEWTDTEIGDAARLSGLLIPFMCGFKQYTERIISGFELSSEHFETIRKLRITEHENALTSLEVNHEKAIKSLHKELAEERIKLSDVERFPMLWTGSYSNLETHGHYGWGVSILAEEFSAPKEGDFVIIVTKKGNFVLGVVGSLIKKNEYADGTSREYRTLANDRNASDIEKLMKKLDVE